MNIFKRKRFLLSSIFLACLGALAPGHTFAEAKEGQAAWTEAAELPAEFGKIVYQKNPERPFQIYIIGNSHRSSSTGDNGAATVPAQVQTYRIGEWLIRRHQVELLLPEGFFGQKGGSGLVEKATLLDEPTLAETLGDTSTFVNADLLLHRNYGIGLHQVEDRELYQNVRDHLFSGQKSGDNLFASFGLELEYLQERRSAAILQRIPDIVGQEYRAGNIARPQAILTIGMAHLDEIIRFLEQERIEVPAPRIGAGSFEAYSDALNLLDQEVGVTVIVPRSILDDRKTMLMAKLEPEAETR